jgi:hypothetical protein
LTPPPGILDTFAAIDRAAREVELAFDEMMRGEIYAADRLKRRIADLRRLTANAIQTSKGRPHDL